MTPDDITKLARETATENVRLRVCPSPLAEGEFARRLPLRIDWQEDIESLTSAIVSAFAPAIASLSETRACGHPKACWRSVFHGPSELGDRCVPEQHLHDLCTACERERKLVETALRMCEPIYRSMYQLPRVTLDDVKKEAGL